MTFNSLVIFRYGVGANGPISVRSPTLCFRVAPGRWPESAVVAASGRLTTAPE